MQTLIRNFSIIAHIDHGKSTLSDRIIEICNNIKLKKHEKRILDNLETEKKRGITIKSQSIQLQYKFQNIIYYFNLIDTPGHIDFSYEVSRALYASEGVLLLIDATQGIESQTLSHYNIAKKLNLQIIPIINKIDLLQNNINILYKQINDLLNIKKKDILICSAKTGYGIKKIIRTIITKISPPKGIQSKPLQALIIDKYYNEYIGVYLLVKVYNGIIKSDLSIKLIKDKKNYKINKIFINKPQITPKHQLSCGEVGWIVCNTKNLLNLPIGSTITTTYNSSIHKLPVFDKIIPKVYASIYPKHKYNFNYFKKTLIKLNANDPSLTLETIHTPLLGYGYKCGFLGLFHIEIIKDRLKTEYNLSINITPPKIKYLIILKNKKKIYIDNPIDYPNNNYINITKEPICICNITTPITYLSNIINICIKKRGIKKNIFIYDKNAVLQYKIPMIEIITNFINELKSISHGYANFEYFFWKFKKTHLIIIDILINKTKFYGLSIFIHKTHLKKYNKTYLNQIKKLISPQQFVITIQLVNNNTVIASTHIKALRKNVTAKCYGGDITRKKKLLLKQKKGKKKLKQMNNFSLPKNIFFKILKI